MKKMFNLFAALALAAGMSAAPSAAAKIKWACVKNDSWLLMRAEISDGRRTSKPSKAIPAGRTACIKIPDGAWFAVLHARFYSAKENHASKTIRIPSGSPHTHISVNAKTNWWGGTAWISGGPWQWSECGKCDYSEF